MSFFSHPSRRAAGARSPAKAPAQRLSRGGDDDLGHLLQRGYRFALALTHDPARAEDLLQDAWVAILRRDAPRRAGYLLRTIRNRFLDLEKRRRLLVLESLDTAEEHDINSLAFLDTASSLPEVGEIEAALGELRAPEREALYLAAVEGYTVREIVELTERPIGTVSSLLQRARKKLSKLLGQDVRRSS